MTTPKVSPVLLLLLLAFLCVLATAGIATRDMLRPVGLGSDGSAGTPRSG
jgi:hypothetical protein